LGLALEMEKVFVRNWLREMSLHHLHVLGQDKSLLIYSIEDGRIARRAVLVRFPRNEYSLCIANPRGQWELIPVVGELPAMLELLNKRLAFSLARWPDARTSRFVPTVKNSDRPGQSFRFL